MNVLMLGTLRKASKIRKAIGAKNNLLINLAIVDLIQALLGYSVQFVDSLLSTHNLNYCTVSGFAITMCGLVSMTLLTMLSFDISFHICRPFKSMLYEDRLPLILPTLGWLYGFFWAIVPFFGLGGYIVEGEKSCSLKWTQDTLQGKIFILALLFGCFVLPLAIIVTCFVCIHVNTKRTLQGGILEKSPKKSRNLKAVQQGNAKLCFFMSFSFIAAWTPYSVVAVIISLSGYDAVPEIILLVAAFMGKCSAIFNPLIFFYIDKASRPYVRRILQLGNIYSRYSKRHSKDSGRSTNSHYSTQLSTLRQSPRERTSDASTGFSKRDKR